ncbi:VOC family protein [Modicisalibacter radicis]|uniref:VOC family protein n=1 Tax=Halomonas sp. EAR18 TaxID=2518972 RepID=UPI00109D1042|nr:VOC family protein [Halomonas sp. EAR18]
MQRLSLGKSVLRVKDLAAMREFFTHVLRLPMLLQSTTTAVFELGTDIRGHTQVLMLISGDGADAPQHLTLEVSDDQFPATCEHLRAQGAALFESDNSSAPGCAWRILACQAPEGHRLQVVSIDPGRCAPASAFPSAAANP